MGFFGSWFWFWRQCNLTLKSMQLSILIWKGVPSGTTWANGKCECIWCQGFINNFSKMWVFLLPSYKMQIIIPLYIFREIYANTIRKNALNRFGSLWLFCLFCGALWVFLWFFCYCCCLGFYFFGGLVFCWVCFVLLCFALLF